MDTQQNKVTTKQKTLVANDLFLNGQQTENVALVRHLGVIRSNKVREVAVFYDEKQQKKASKWTGEKKQKTLRKFKLLKAIFSKIKSVSEVQDNIDIENIKVKDCKESNLNAVYVQTKPFEKAARALDLLHTNKGDTGKVILFPVDKKRFAEPGNNFMLTRGMKNLLEKEFYKFELKASPLYITYLGEIEDQTILRQLAEIACTTKALAVLDVPVYEQVDDFLEFADDFNITGVEEKLGHLVLPSSHVKIEGVKDYGIKEIEGKFIRIKEKDMAIPAAGGFVGSLLAAEPGESIAGIHRRGISGGTGVIMEYGREKIDSGKIAAKGFVMLGYINNSVRILGTRTGNVSDKSELHQFSKVDIRNTIAKALIQFSNDEVFGAWGGRERTMFIDKLRDYLNKKVAKGVIAGYKLDAKDVKYNKTTKRVEITLVISYTDIVDGFVFSLEGSPGGIELKN